MNNPFIFNKKSVLPEGIYGLRGRIIWWIAVKTGGRYSLIVWIRWKFKILGSQHIMTYILIIHKCITCFGTILSTWQKIWPQWLFL